VAVIRQVQATRYVTPLREGGSLPGIVEADDFGTYVMKFRGAGQGLKVLVAEVIVGELARRLGLRVPELTAVELDATIGKYEADEEVQDLLTASVGLNLGVDFLPGSFGWDAHISPDPVEAGRILWLDAFTANVDRSWRNPNVLIWHRQLWLIDHGAALYFHHGWSRGATAPERFAGQPYDASDHIMIGHADQVPSADAELSPRVTRELLEEVLAQVPDEWLEPGPGLADVGAVREAYTNYLLARVAGSRTWLPTRSAA
jgi:HipA-like protein